MDKKSSLQKSSSFSTGEFSQVINAGKSISPPLIIFSQSKTPPLSRQATHFSFGYVSPEVIKSTGHGNPVDIWWTGITTLRMHRRTTSSFPSLHSHHHLGVPLCGCPPPLSWQHHRPRLAKLRSQNRVCRTGALFPIEIKPNPLSGVSPLLIRSTVVPRRLYATLGLPPPTPSHVDLSPTLRQNWSPRASGLSWLASGLPTGLLHLLLLRATWARKVMER